MKTKNSKNQNKESERDGAAISENAFSEIAASELREPRWSVVSFETRTAKNLTYSEAEQRITQLGKQGVSGLCIITDEAAERISGADTGK